MTILKGFVVLRKERLYVRNSCRKPLLETVPLAAAGGSMPSNARARFARKSAAFAEAKTGGWLNIVRHAICRLLKRRSVPTVLTKPSRVFNEFLTSYFPSACSIFLDMSKTGPAKRGRKPKTKVKRSDVRGVKYLAQFMDLLDPLHDHCPDPKRNLPRRSRR